MVVLALLVVNRIGGISGSTAGITLFGCSSDGAFNFRDDSADGPLQVTIPDINSFRLKRDIEDAAKARLQLSPYNMTFGSGDVVRLIP